jgi:predicted pyridoxine 5'-phosphate oxidase superfamily flavin-nucleotide-binding protein
MRRKKAIRTASLLNHILGNMKMGKLTQEMKDLIEAQRICSVAAANKNEKANVSPKVLSGWSMRRL